MTIDYDAIADENLKKYGTAIDKYGPVLLSDLYSDQTHFVYELLQNAEDAGATEVIFRLFHDGLEYEHNGRIFNEDDIRGICGLVEGTKTGDLTKIGKFGIGFKSVYAHTHSPEIHSGDEHFGIRNYVQPYSVNPQDTHLGTLFIFPFNHESKDTQKSYSEIAARLRDLGIRTLLFLRNIESISYEIAGDVNGAYLREIEAQDDFWRRVMVIGQHQNNEYDESWLVFTRRISPEEPLSQGHQLTVEIAFQYERNEDIGFSFRSIPKSQLAVYFPTEKETHLGFVIQGPYRTTPARDNIPQNHPFNRFLVNETGELITEALRYLRGENAVTVELLQTLPIDRRHFQGTLFENLFQRILEMMTHEALIPAYDGGYVPGEHAKFAGSENLRRLLDRRQLQQLLKTENTLYWIAAEVSQDRTPALRQYMREELKIEQIDSESFVRRLNVEFLKSQSDEWIREFYEFALDFGDWITNLLKQQPIIRLQDGKHVNPFDQNNKPLAYLPTQNTTRYPTVKDYLADTEPALKFLHKLGLREPGVVDEVLTMILPKYRRSSQIIDTEHLHDIDRIYAGLKTDSMEKRTRLINELKRTRFLIATNAADETKVSYRTPEEIYISNPELVTFFDGHPKIWFLDEIYQDIYDEIIELGVHTEVQVRYQQPRYNGFVIVRNWHSDHVRGLDSFDPDCSVEGLEYAVLNPTIERSAFVWNKILIPYRKSVHGTIQRCRVQTFPLDRISEETTFSKMGLLAYEHEWLPNRDGYFFRPRDISFEELHENFTRDAPLAKLLGMKISSQDIDENAVYDLLQGLGLDGIESSDKAFITDLMKMALDDPEELKELRHFREQRKRAQQSLQDEIGVEEGVTDYSTSLESAFNKEGETSLSNNEIGSNSLRNPDQRSQRKKQSIKDAIEEEPDRNKRVKYSTNRRWEGKDKYTREYLRNEYNGRCQICDFTFPLRNGDAYFEALYIVSYTEGRWLDDPANTLCLCANHVAEFLHGSVKAQDILKQIKSYDPGEEHLIAISLCGSEVTIRFSARHIFDLNVLIEFIEELES